MSSRVLKVWAVMVVDSELPDRRRLVDAGLLGSELPRDVLRAAGRWMADRLDDQGFVWKQSRSLLESLQDGRSERITLESNRWNRRDTFVAITVAKLAVYDDSLEEWRGRHPDLTADRPSSVAGIVCSTSYLDISRNAQCDLTRPAERVQGMERLLRDVQEIGIPWLSTTRRREEVAGSVPDAVLGPTAFAQDILEFLFHRGLTDQAASLIHRFIAMSPAHEAAFRQGRDMGRAGERPRWHTPPALGWSSFVLGVD